MKKFKFYCTGVVYPETVEFDDTWTKEEIEQELWDWVKENADIWMEEVDEDDDDE